METKTITPEISNGKKAIVEQILASKEINPKEQDCKGITVWDPKRKINHLSKVV